MFNQHFYYQFAHVLYMQSYFMLVYFSSSEWSSQDYNNYWKSKSNQTSQSVDKSADQSQLSASKQFLMITAGTAAASELQSVYSNFRQEVNFHHDQDWYEQITENQSQSFYSIWSYHIAKCSWQSCLSWLYIKYLLLWTIHRSISCQHDQTSMTESSNWTS